MSTTLRIPANVISEASVATIAVSAASRSDTQVPPGDAVELLDRVAGPPLGMPAPSFSGTSAIGNECVGRKAR
jgi:hypothetical protein